MHVRHGGRPGKRVAEHNIGAKLPHRGDFAEIMKADNGGSTFPGNKKERRPIVRFQQVLWFSENTICADQSSRGSSRIKAEDIGRQQKDDSLTTEAELMSYLEDKIKDLAPLIAPESQSFGLKPFRNRSHSELSCCCPESTCKVEGWS